MKLRQTTKAVHTDCLYSSRKSVFYEKYFLENNFKSILKELRQERGVGQVEPANALGDCKGIISLWEDGLREPTMSSLLALSKYFNVTIDYLVKGEL